MPLTHTATHTTKKADESNGDKSVKEGLDTEKRGVESGQNGRAELLFDLRNQQVVCSGHITSSKF